jgi:hypothetical protein
MIEKKHSCPATLCGKTYGAEGSLQQHIKLKHPELYSRPESEQPEESESSSSSDYINHF